MQLLKRALKKAESLPKKHPAFVNDNTPANFNVICSIVEQTILQETGQANEPLAVSIAWNVASSLPASALIPPQAADRITRSKKKNPKPLA